jgi:hypothetical protein
MLKVRHISIILFAMLFAFNASAQRKVRKPIGYGASAIYNFQAEGIGADLRVRIPTPVNNLYVVPEISYYPPFNRYHELYAGGALQYDILRIRSYNLYLLGAAYYNFWINADDYAPEGKKKHNFAPEVGGGLVRNRGCWRPFIENRYDFKWKEDNLRIGIYYYPGQCRKSTRREKCPTVKGI